MAFYHPQFFQIALRLWCSSVLSRAIFAIRGEGGLGKINGKKCEKQNFPQRRVAIRIGNEGRNSK